MSGNQMVLAGLMCAVCGAFLYNPQPESKFNFSLNLPMLCKKTAVNPNSDIGRICDQYQQIEELGNIKPKTKTKPKPKPKR